jgi:hypothetical protein
MSETFSDSICDAHKIGRILDLALPYETYTINILI